MTQKFRWGILGTGVMARKFAEGLATIPDAEVVAVGSRSTNSANNFANTYKVPNAYNTYNALAEDSNVDAVYVSTPNTFHKNDSLLCLQSQKNVLCEKPFCINAYEAKEIIVCARKNGLFLMEAMWTRFLPAITELRRLLSSSVIGEVRMLFADFGFEGDYNPQKRLLNPELGGGSLLDVGVYTLSFSSMILGTPNKVCSIGTFGETGVDEQSSYILGYPGGQQAILASGIKMTTPQIATIVGTEGYIQVERFWYANKILVVAKGNEPEILEIPIKGNGYNYEAQEVMNCVREGKLESNVMPLDESLSIMSVMDQIREQWGLKYPSELRR
jgi:dihydrodiol dehydrogenase / D-xylose 1-dehydrogenase (NADP)